MTIGTSILGRGPSKKGPKPKRQRAQLTALRLSNMNRAPRCKARTRRGTECQQAAVRGKARCRMHGGAKGSGAPKGERNGAWRGGGSTNEAKGLRREVAALLRGARAVIRRGRCAPPGPTV